MGEIEESLNDYIAFGVIGFAIGMAIAGIGGGDVMYPSVFSVDWGKVTGQHLISGIFAYMPAGVIAGYLGYKLHKTESKTKGLTIGFMAFLAYLIITLIIAICRAALIGYNLGNAMSTWALGLVFALIFYPLGGFLSGYFAALTVPLPAFLRFQRFGMAPPPPPPDQIAQTCPTCGSPLRYVEQYQRWYCDKEEKYV
jgi:cbb3-type cytochrome oxidase subunit 1